VKRLLVLVACAVVVASACTKPAGVAAAVNGVRITNSSLVDELNAIKGNGDLLAYYQQSQPVLGEKPGTFNLDFVSEVLLEKIQFELVRQDLTHRHVVPDDGCRAAGQNDAYSTYGAGDVDKGRQILDALPSWFRDELVSRHVNLLALQASLINQPCVSSDAARAYYDAHTSDFDESCLSVIQLTDPSQVDAIMAQLRGGADFATVAKASSADPGSAANGGDVGCLTKNRLPAQVVDAAFNTPVGQVADPIQSSQGTLILKVTDRKTPAYADVQSEAEELAASASNDTLGQWYTQVVANATVAVDGRYGTWNPQSGSLTPAATATSTTTPTAPTDTTPSASTPTSLPSSSTP